MSIKLFTSSSIPIIAEIDNKTYVLEKLTILDYHMLGAVVLNDLRSELDAEHEAKLPDVKAADIAAFERDHTNAKNALQAPTPYELINTLLNSFDGFALVLFTCLHKKHPEVTFEWVQGITLTDELTQLVYDLMDLQRKVVPAEKRATSQDYLDYTTRKAALADDDTAGRAELGKWAFELGMLVQAREVVIEALKIDPKTPGAEALAGKIAKAVEDEQGSDPTESTTGLETSP